MARRVPDLTIRWSKREKALLYDGCKPTAGLLAGVLERITLGAMDERLCGVECKRNGLIARLRTPDPSDSRTLAQELEARGYDMSTLRLSIHKKAKP